MRHHGCGNYGHPAGDVFFYMGRHRGGHRFGRFGGGFMGGDPGDRDFRMGRKLASGDLQLLVLALLVERPRHGYEIIKALEERSSGFYVPSPGMVYPALTYLEEIGHATVEAEGSKKLYQVTDDGRAYLEKNRGTVDSLFEQMERAGRKMEQVRRFFSGDPDAAAEESDEEGYGPRGNKEVWLATRELRAVLHEKKHHSTPEERRRIAEILRRAAEEIRGT